MMRTMQYAAVPPARSVLRSSAVVLLAGAVPWLSGCQVLGPTAMAAGRGAYTQVIAQTNAEQLLGTVVRLRYSDPVGFLSVSSVTASLKFGANAGAEFGVGPSSNYSGNLVPLSAGVSYEDNPTISYTPVTGQAFVRDWLAPLSLDFLVLALEGGRPDPSRFSLLVSRMNGLRSPFDGDPSQGAGFLRAGELLVELAVAGAGAWGAVPGTTDRFELALHGRDDAQRAQIEELLRLLEIPLPSVASGAPIRVPLKVGSWTPGEPSLAIRTRSLAQILQSAAASVEVPARHVEEGIVVDLPRPSAGSATHPTPGTIVIRSSREAPGHATVAVQHRGWWYYIDDTDLASKRNFQWLEMLFMMRLSDAQRGAQTAPVLTIPVG